MPETNLNLISFPNFCTTQLTTSSINILKIPKMPHTTMLQVSHELVEINYVELNQYQCNIGHDQATG